MDEDEEKSKLLSGNTQGDEGRPMPLRNREYINSATNQNDQIDSARNRLQFAIEEYNSLVKNEPDELDNIGGKQVQTLPNTILIHGGDDNKKGTGKGPNGKKQKKRCEADQNNNKNKNNGKSKVSRFSSIRRATLRRQVSNRAIERSASGMSEVDYLSRYIFPIAFILFATIYWISLFYFKLS